MSLAFEGELRIYYYWIW